MDTLLACIPMANTGKQAGVTPNSQQLSIDDLDISVRSRNCLKEANILTVRDLEKHTDEELLRIPNLGLKSLVDIRRAMHSLGFMFRDAPSTTETETTEQQIDNIIHDSVSNAEPVLLEDELLRIASLCGERNAEIATRKYGFAGNEPETLQNVGDQFQITRERVRQICNKVAAKIRGRKPKAPTLELAISIVQQHLPAKAEFLQSKLFEAGITRGLFSITSLAEAAKLILGTQPFLVVTLGPHHFALDASFEKLPAAWFEKFPKKIIETARRTIEHWGVSTITNITDQLETHYKNYAGRLVNDSVIRTILMTREDFCWLDEVGGWFWLSSLPRNRVLNQIEKILSVAGNIDVSELRSGVARNYRMEGFAPPKRVLLEFCRQTPGYRVVHNTVTTEPQLNWKEVLADTEATMVDILFKNGSVLSREEFEKLCMQRGMNRSTFYVYLGNSPVITRYARGVYGIRGANINPGVVESLKPTYRQSEKLIADHGWKDQRCWVKYKLSKAMLDSGVIHLPAPLKKYIHGNYTLKSEDGKVVGRLVVKDSNAWGLGPFFRRSGGEPGDYLILNFNLAQRETSILIGDEALLEENIAEFR